MDTDDPKGSKVRLTEKETSILRYLYRAGQRPVSRETLLQEVWGYNSGVTTHTLETHIYRLRQKIEKDAAAPAILVTESRGYKLHDRSHQQAGRVGEDMALTALDLLACIEATRATCFRRLDRLAVDHARRRRIEANRIAAPSRS
jgi:DNA-binding winged helix-turn-helix (wHTH) protein